ncbi:MAG TPA: DUF362 domain-containing protein [Bacteroidales bacterium]|nr:DUF362 domain-containing protein [Bacteroidales bacterium]
MKRRDFIRVSSAAGVMGLINPVYGTGSMSGMVDDQGFDLHPFIKEHPEAVFINLTSVSAPNDKQAIHDAAFRLAGEIMVRTSGGEGFPLSTRITCKPNWTCTGRIDPKNPDSQLGITTDVNFIEGFLKAVKNLGPEKFYLRECACPHLWNAAGYTAMAERNGFDLRDLSSKDFWDLAEGDIIFRKVDGVVFKEVGFMAPMTAQDTFLINIAKLKSHQMGITGAIKNLQGMTGRKFHQFCGGHYDIFKTYDERYHKFFQPDYMDKIAELQKKHEEQGIPRWRSRQERPPYGGGMFMEQWVQRMIDAYSVAPTGINIVEGIYGRDGDGFSGGPHNGKAMNYMSNNIIFGKDAFRVDIIAHWLAGHEPGNFGLFHIGIERGVSNVLNPFDIPVYLWEDGKAKKVSLDTLKRTPLLTLYMRRNYDGQNEDQYHMVDEPFDYSAWETGKITSDLQPSIKALGADNNNGIVMEVNVPEESDVYVDIKNRHGDVVWRLRADGFEPGKHEVVWDGFSQPGMYTMYVKGMGWDAEREMVIYT